MKREWMSEKYDWDLETWDFFLCVMNLSIAQKMELKQLARIRLAERMQKEKDKTYNSTQKNKK